MFIKNVCDAFEQSVTNTPPENENNKYYFCAKSNTKNVGIIEV